MASINANNVDSFRGTMLLPTKQGRRVERFGISEIGHIAGATIPQTSTVETLTYVADAATATTTQETYQAIPYSGGVVVVDGLGNTWNDCIVESCAINSIRNVINDGVGQVEISATWQISVPDQP